METNYVSYNQIAYSFQQLIKNKDFEDLVIDQSKALASENVRDYYVNYYLAFNDGFAEIEGKQVAFQEKPLT